VKARGMLSFGKRFFATALAFTLLPVPTLTLNSFRTLDGVHFQTNISLEETAVADNFQSLGDQLGGQRVEELAIFCNYVDRINSVMSVLQKAAAVQTATSVGLAHALISQAESIPMMCNLAMAILSAKNLDGVLRAARMANRMYSLGQQGNLDFIEDSVDLAISLDEFGKSKDSNIDKALNAGMYAKVLDYAFKYTSLQKSSSLAKETAVVSSRQTQLIADMKTNNQCLELSTSGKQDQANESLKEVGVVELANGFLMKTSEATRLMSKQQKALALLNGSGIEHIKILGASLMNMIQTVEHRGTDALEVSGEIIRRLIDSEQPYAAVGYDFSRVTPVLTKKDGEIRFEENDFCNKAAVDGSDPEGQKISEDTRKRKCKLFKEKVNMKQAYYKDSEKGRVSPCGDTNKNQYKLELFEARNIPLLADPNYDPRVLSTVSLVCQKGSFDSIQINQLLAGLEKAQTKKDEARLYTDEDAANLEKKKQSEMQDNCVEGASAAALKRFNSLRGFGPSADNAFEADWKSQVGCAPANRETLAKAKKDGETVKYQKFSQDFSTVRKWRDFYNTRLNDYISTTYKGIEDSSFAQSLRGTKKMENALAPDDTSYGNGNKWSEGQDTWNDPLPKIRRLQSELGLVSLCELPTYLTRKYPDKKEVINGTETSDPKALLQLIQQCRNEQEGNVNDYFDIFDTYVTALYDEKVALAQARADLFDIDVMFGAYVGTTGVRKTNECNSVRSTELNTQLTNNMLGTIAGTLMDMQKREMEKDLAKNDQDKAIDEANQILKARATAKESEIRRATKTSTIKQDPSTATYYPPPGVSKEALKYVDPKFAPQNFKPSK
jgi:hypothetical protein